MKIKSIRGSIKYNGTVYEEGDIFEIEDTDFSQLQENIEIVEDNLEDEQTYSNDEVMDIELDEVDLNSFNISTLKKIAKEKDIKLSDKMTKQEIINAIESNGK
ncbi:MAG: Rho termination factor N-terminal domain-containing protein [Peptoanaerobacter stomatis]|uniref:Rho termination factor N-terminal domain-containing protein n=1 Tax=Peptoanaerobacter stomatis TaxID=796937 RepID=UPI003F9FE29C